MSLKMIVKDQSGFTYTLEAILGIFLIMGTVIYVTANMPYTAQKTGEHSKVQLMNIGRDTLDLTLITPVYETCPSCVNPQVHRKYLLVVDKTFVMPGETVNFTVTYSDGTQVNKWLTLQNTTLGTGDPFKNMTKIYNTVNWSWSDSPQNLSTFSIQANDFSGGISNIVTIKVGWYFLDSNTNGVYGDGNVSGVVYYPNYIPAPNLTISLFGPLSTACQANYPNITKTNATGNFSFGWPSYIKTYGLYYIIATDSSSHSSNKHLIIYSDSGGGGTLWVYNPPPYPGSNQTATIMELSPVSLYATGMAINNLNNLYINNAPYNSSDPSYRFNLYPNGTLQFTAYLAGDYYIYFQQGAATCTGNGPVKTNGVLIQVLPIIPATGDTQDNCVNATELNTYMRRYMPAYVNYNLYLIGPAGNRFMGCPDFPNGEVINGYPTAEAVAVYKLAHIKYDPTDIDNMVEFRTVLWYK